MKSLYVALMSDNLNIHALKNMLKGVCMDSSAYDWQLIAMGFNVTSHGISSSFLLSPIITVLVELLSRSESVAFTLICTRRGKD